MNPRLNRLFAADGKCFDVAIDHGFFGEASFLAGIEDMVRSDGILELYETEAELQGTARDDAAKRAEGIEFRHVRGAELAELQPGLSVAITCGTFIPKWQTVSDPYDYAVAVAKAAMERGARFHKGEVVQLRPQDDGVIVEMGDGSAIRAKQVAVCTRCLRSGKIEKAVRGGKVAAATTA